MAKLDCEVLSWLEATVDGDRTMNRVMAQQVLAERDELLAIAEEAKKTLDVDENTVIAKARLKCLLYAYFKEQTDATAR